MAYICVTIYILLCESDPNHFYDDLDSFEISDMSRRASTQAKQVKDSFNVLPISAGTPYIDHREPEGCGRDTRIVSQGDRYGMPLTAEFNGAGIDSYQYSLSRMFIS